MTTDLIADLQARGLVHDSTDLTALGARLGEGAIGVYVGFDPTADSLHAGHLLGQLTLRRFQLAGHRPFPLAGGATGMVGDPGGRSEERNLLDAETLEANVAAIKGQLERILDFTPGPTQATLVDNAAWTSPLGVLDFLRDVGKHVTVNQMAAKESVRARMESEHGISFTEFSYMLLQANDFRHLFEHHGVELQMGGSDQWGNITTGIDLVRKVLGGTTHGLTWPLLTKADGSKFGKTAGGAVWLDPARTSPYRFHQFWVQTEDAEVRSRLLQFTMRPVAEVDELVAAHEADPGRRQAQRALAHDVTELVHGPAATAAAEEAATVMFGGRAADLGPDALDTVLGEIPVGEVPPDDVAAGLPVAEALRLAGLVKSLGEGRRVAEQGGAYVNGERAAADRVLGAGDLLHGGVVLLRRGKRDHAALVDPARARALAGATTPEAGA